jgi:pyruvate/2-oxoglutarate/acetoin dehydrogenase E1 component
MRILQTAGFGAGVAAVVADEAFIDLDAPVARNDARSRGPSSRLAQVGRSRVSRRLRRRSTNS